MHAEQVVYVVAGILVAGVAAQWLGWRLQVPAIVFLLFGGLLAGPVTGVLDPDEAFGDVLFASVELAVAVILFEGALGMGWRGVREAGRPVLMLLTVGATITFVGGMAAAHGLLGVDWNLAALVAAVLVVTGPTVIGPILRAIGLQGRVGAILEAEGTLIDSLGAIAAVIVFQVAYGSIEGGSSVVLNVLATLGIGTLIGVAGAALLGVALARYLIPEALHNTATLAVVIGSFAVANAIRSESGLVAVTVMGIALASHARVPVRHVLEFNETLRIVFISGLFLLLGARISPDTLRDVEWRNLAFLAVLVVVVRPVSVFVSTLGTGLGKRERIFIGATAPRGIVAAAIASIYSLRLAELEVANSQVLVSATFTVIAGTVLISGLGAKPLARRLRLLDLGAPPIVLLGANPVSRALATALERHGASVRLLDLSREQVAVARLTGLDAQQGSVLAEQTWEDPGLQRAACFVALTANDELNMLAARHAATVLGRRRVFQLPPGRPEHEAWWTLPVGTFARPLFARDATYRLLADRLEKGWRVTTTEITPAHGPDEHARVSRGAISLFTVDGRGHVDLMATDAPRRLRVGDTVVALSPPS